MAKTPLKPLGISNTSLNSPNPTPKLDSKLSKNQVQKEYKPASKKSRQQINKEYYEKNKEERQKQRRDKYQQEKEQSQLATKQQSAKYYGAEAIKVLMTLKEYTELNKEKQKL